MKLTVFQSDQGDCLMLTGEDGANVLVDGGMRSSYREYVRPELGTMREEKEKLDLICVSHIDRDHISGVLELLDDEVDWRVYEHHRDDDHGNKRWKEPRFERPPEVSAIWHNAFHDIVSKNRGRIEDMLGASAGFLFGAGDESLSELAEQYMDLIASKAEAIQLSRRLGAEQLDIPLNEDFDGKLALVSEEQASIPIGTLNVSVIGPFREDLEKLRDEWNKWLDVNQDRIARLRRNALRDGGLLEQVDASKLADIGLRAAGGLGDRGRVTPANLASLMLLVEENGKDILLTGDGHADDILKGLKHHGKLNEHGGIHLAVLKVQHHGSEHNTTAEFAKLVTADHYVFCGNGAHRNPDPAVVGAYAQSRIGDDSQRSKNPETDRPFHFWFNSSSRMKDAKKKHSDHMKRLEDQMRVHEQNSDDQLSYTFFDSAKAIIDLSP